MKLRNMIGPPVEGNDFFGRDLEINETWSDLEDGNHLLISAPRRIGKSSLVKRLIHKALENNWHATYVDVQDLTSELQFYKSLVMNLKEDTDSWFKKHREKALSSLEALLSRIELGMEVTDGTEFKIKWSPGQLKEIKEEIKNLLSNCDNLLIAIDELPFFLARIEKEENGRQRVSDLLHWLRALRQDNKNKVRWIFCGSIGIDTFTTRLRLSEAFNDVQPYHISAFDEETARRFLVALGKDNGLNLTDEHAAEMVEIMGWPLPYFLQLHFKQLKRLKRSALTAPITSDNLQHAYKNIIADLPALKTWEERLHEQLNAQEVTSCKTLLKALCQSKKGLSRKNLFTLLYPAFNDTEKCEDSLSFSLDLLIRDGYLIENNRKYGFRSPLLRDFWYSVKVK